MEKPHNQYGGGKGMKLTLRQNAELERMKSEIACQYGVKDFEDIWINEGRRMKR